MEFIQLFLPERRAFSLVSIKTPDNSRYDPNAILSRMPVGRAKHCSHQMLLLFVIDGSAYNKWQTAVAIIAGLKSKSE